MIRLQCCHSIWPADEKIHPYSSTSIAPLRYYKIDEKTKCGCYFSSELIFTSIGKVILTVLGMDIFTLRIFGVIRALILLFTASGISFFLLNYRNNSAAVINSLIFSVVLCDPANSLFLNTFYTEFSALLFCYLSIGAMYCLLMRPSHKTMATIFLFALWALGLSKPQHVALPILFWGCFVLFSWKDRQALKWIYLIAGIGTIAIAVFQMKTELPHMKSARWANATDTFLGAVLPASRNQLEAVKILNLPEDCILCIGKDWYSPGVQKEHPCPEVFSTSRVRLLWLMIKQPIFLLDITEMGLDKLCPWVVTYIGHVEGEKYDTIWGHQLTLAGLENRIPRFWMKALFVFPIIVISFLLWVTFRKNNNISPLSAILTAMAGGGYIVFYSSLFGDGFVQFSKHSHLYFSIYCSMGIMLLVNIPVLSLKHWKKRAESKALQVY
ncbi:MAG: hypothetical protein KJ737_01905 [Proteobacteria bacterium]|nr:hypothetical protein [Pseudomonadota bacterium]